ncbi:Olfactory receptor 2T27 [Sciurus carolinensis]|uniref:Olfactory receptor 2T27 n=1 Tax=Sciurus carolinensis TaxID=30640 RepID=A0AA41SRR0_SCICA|nr:Olfactory receptor 2T27 [Sciurus carolinensis]
MEWGNGSLHADFVLLGLFSGSRAPWLLFALILLVFVASIASNATMILLIRVDPRLHTPMGLMSYDRYGAICYPLSHRVCLLIVAAAWLGGSADGFLLTPVTMQFPFCASRDINHFFCEAPALLKLSCRDTSAYETAMYVCCFLMLLIPFSVTSASYNRILIAVYRMSEAEGRRKAVATCSSHMVVVSLFYGAAMYTYVLPHAYHTPEQDKAVSAFYTILTPVLNPLIYSLRNRDVTGALQRALGKCLSSGKVTTS